MVDPATTILGGLVGAIIGVFFGDPYRNGAGQFTTRQKGFASWIFQATFGALFGATLTGITVPILVINPIFGLPILSVLC